MPSRLAVRLVAPPALLAGVLTALMPVDGRAQLAYSIAPPPGWVEALPVPDERPEEPNLRPDTNDGGQNTQLLLMSLQDRATRTGSAYYLRLRYRVRGAGAIQENSQVHIRFNPVYQELILHTATVHRDSQQVEQLAPERIQVYDQESSLSAQVVDGWKTVVLFLEDVRPGDVIDYSYTVRGSNPVFAGHYMREFPLGLSGKVGRLHARLLWERDRPPWIRVHSIDAGPRIPGFRAQRIDLEPRIREVGGTTEYTWDLQDTEAVLEEPRTPVWFRAGPFVQVSDFASWAEVAEWGRDLFRVDAPLPDELDRLVEEIRAAHAGDPARLEAALRFVQDEIRYLAVSIGENSHRPYPPAVVLERRYGDCKDKSILLITMLEALGIQAHPALVSTVYGAHVSDFHPTAGIFDHVIVQVRVGEDVYWVDPTRLLDREALEPDASPHGAALVLAAGTDGLGRLQLREAGRPERDIVTRLEIGAPDEATTMTVETVYRRGSATQVRQYFQNTLREQIARGYLEYYSELYPGIESAGAVEMRDDEAANEVVVTEHYRIPDFWYEPEGTGGLVGELHPLEIASSLPASASRNRSMPLAVDHPLWIRSVIEARLEEGWSIEPEESTVTAPGVHFSYTAEAVDEILRLTYEYRTLADHVPPDSLTEHLQGVERIGNLLGYSIVPPLSQIAGGGAGAGDLNWVALILALALTAAAVVGARRVATVEGIIWPHHPADPPGEPRGLRGWLILVGINVVVISLGSVVLLLVTLVPILDARTWSFLTTPGSVLHTPGLAPVLVIQAAVYVVIAVFGGVLAWAFFRKKRLFPGLFVGLILLGCVPDILDAVMGEALTRVSDMEATSLGQAGGGVVVALIWTLYMIRSRRVQNTFTE